MNFLRVKGVVREARHISEAMTRLFSPKEAICEMCEMSQIGIGAFEEGWTLKFSQVVQPWWTAKISP